MPFIASPWPATANQLADVVVDFMRGYFGCGMFFLVRDGQARVWRGFASGIQEAAIETIAFPVSMPSCFQLATIVAPRFRARPRPRAASCSARSGSTCTARNPPRSRWSGPGEKRVLNLVYAHAADGGPLPMDR